MLSRNDRLFTSAMTVGEVLVKPIAMGNAAFVNRYRELFSSDQITVCPFGLSAAETYGRIRQDRTIQPADAIQLACASSADIDLFLTNDDRLSQKHIQGIKFLTSLARAPM